MNRAALLGSLALFGAGAWLWSRRAVASESPLDGLDPLGLLMPLGSGSMRLSDSGLDMLKRVEGFSATPYADAGDFSIGYGHFGLDDLVFPGEAIPSITQAGAAQLLARDVQKAENAVNRAVAVPLTQSQFDALVSFAYNVGATAFSGSTLVRKLNAGDYSAVPAELRRWCLSQGAPSSALASRREVEIAHWSIG